MPDATLLPNGTVLIISGERQGQRGMGVVRERVESSWTLIQFGQSRLYASAIQPRCHFGFAIQFGGNANLSPVSPAFITRSRKWNWYAL
jgi:hypothetical protein